MGAGAHGKVTDSEGVHRYTKPANPLSYMQAMQSQQPQPLPQALGESELLFEFMLNALRLRDGFDESLFEQRTGLPADSLADAAAAATERGLIELSGARRWQPTALGRRFLNDLQAEFLPN